LGTLTDTKLKALKPEQKEKWINDGNGLYVRIRPNGRKFFVTRYTFNGKNKKITLGEYPALKLLQARKKNLEIKEKLAQGIDPLEERQQIKKEMEEAEKLKIEENLNKHKLEKIIFKWLEKKEKTISDVTYNKLLGRINNYIVPLLGNKYVEDITKKDIIEAVKKMKHIKTMNNTKNTDRTYTYRAVFGALKEFFRYCLHNDYVAENPCDKIDINEIIGKHQAEHFKAIIKADEFKKLYNDIKECYFLNDTTKNALLFLAQTALRPINIRKMRWEWIDFNALIITFPADFMKARRDFRLPLTENLLKIITQQQEITQQKSKYVFPSPISPTKEMSENTLNYALKRMNYTNHTAHGFRSSFSSICYEKQHEHGFSSEIIEMQLAHLIGNTVTRAYMRSDFLEERRELLKWWYEFLEA